MTVDYLKQQEQIKTYIETNFPIVLQEMGLPDMDAYIDDFLDLDKYQKSKQLFYNFGTYSYDYLSNESENEVMVLNIYLTFQKGKPSELITKMKRYTAALIEMFKRSGNNFGGIVDIGIYENVYFYLAAEGSTDVKVADIQFRLTSEK